MSIKVDTGKSVISGKQPGTIMPYVAPDGIVNAEVRGTGNHSALENVDRLGDEWAQLGNSGVDATVRGMVDAGTHPLAFPKLEEVK